MPWQSPWPHLRRLLARVASAAGGTAADETAAVGTAVHDANNQAKLINPLELRAAGTAARSAQSWRRPFNLSRGSTTSVELSSATTSPPSCTRRGLECSSTSRNRLK